MKFRLTRRRFLAGCAIAGVGAAGGAFVDLRYVEPGWLKQTRVKVALAGQRLSKPIRILHLSDFHASDNIPIEFVRRAAELGLAHKPDLVCYTGDLVNRRIVDHRQYASALQLLSENCPCFACPGNHDGGSWAYAIGGYPDLGEAYRLLADAGISLLVNASKTVPVHGISVKIVGLGDYWADNVRANKAFPRKQTSEFALRIVLAHNPDCKDLIHDYSWDLMLCGHTHGGQLSLPILGTPFAPVRDQGYVYGLNEWDGRWIYTTSGVGNLHGMRLNCRPEIAIIEIA